MTGTTLAITVGSADAEALRSAVDSGEYPSVDAALADALATWSRRDQDREENLAWVRAKIRASIADPSPSLSTAELKAHLKKVSARSRSDDDAAA